MPTFKEYMETLEAKQTKLMLKEFITSVVDQSASLEIRIGDVAEGSDLHCSVGRIELRGNCIVLTPGDDDVWKDETVASAQLSEHLWPNEEDANNES